MDSKVTSLAAWRAAHPAHGAISWHKAAEEIARANLRIIAAMQRLAWRAFWRL